MTAFTHKLIHNFTTQSKQVKWPQMAATFHTYERLLHHRQYQYAHSRWYTVQCTPLHCNNSEFTIHLMVVDCQALHYFSISNVKTNGFPKILEALSYSAVHEISEGGPIFTFSLPGWAARIPATPRSVTPLVVSK